jgi:hypothetical protein
MDNFNVLLAAAKQLIAQNDAYVAKPTKAESKRMRATISDIQKAAVEAKRDLIKADEALSVKS